MSKCKSEFEFICKICDSTRVFVETSMSGRTIIITIKCDGCGYYEMY